MKTPAFYAFVFGLSLSSCQTVKGPQNVAHSPPTVALKGTTGSKNQISEKKAGSNIKEVQTREEQQAPKGARFFGEIWIRPGKSWFSNKEGHTLEMAQDDGQDADPNALSYFTLKSMYHGVAPQKSSGGRRIYKLVWRPYNGEGLPRKQQARPPIPPLEKTGPLP